MIWRNGYRGLSFNGGTCRNFGGNSQSSTNSTENVTQPTATAQGGGVGVASTGQVTVNADSPLALAQVGNAIGALQQTAGEAIQAAESTTGQNAALVAQQTASPVQQYIPIVIVIAILIGIVSYFRHRAA